MNTARLFIRHYPTDLLGDVGEFGPPSDDVVVGFGSTLSVGLEREDAGGAREGAVPGGTNI